LVWGDEFNGTSLSTANWNVDVGNPGVNSEQEYYLASNVVETGGDLVITARQQTVGGTVGFLMRLLSRGISGGLHLLLIFFQIFYSLFLFPKYILHLLVFIQEAIDVDVCVVLDVVAELAVGFRVAGGMFVQAIQGHVLVQQDRIDTDDLFLVEVDQSFLHGFELVDGLFYGLWLAGRIDGGGGGLGMRGQCGDQYAG
jgi:hypothetical protein